MTTCTELEYALSPGYNTDDFTVITGLVPYEGAEPILQFRGWATYDPGIFTVRGDGTLLIEGFPTAQWIFNLLNKYQLKYLMDTYCGGGYSGLVSVQTTSDIPDTLVTFNAVMTIKKLPEQNPYYSFYLPATITFTRMVATSEPLTLVESGIGLQFVSGEQFNLVNV